jgi:CheY-like chemotaxis protein
VFRILIVDDDSPTSKQLKSIIIEQIEDVHADTALDVPDAEKFLKSAHERKQPYDAVVLDLMLPIKKGSQPELDESLCLKIREKWPDTLVAHITAYDRNETVKNHLETVHDRQIDRSFRLAKKPGFSRELIDKLKPFLYGLRIKAQLNKLFNGGAGMGYTLMGGRLREPASDRSITHELAALTRDIASHWKYLDKGLQEQIKEIFNVTVNKNEVTVSLF